MAEYTRPFPQTGLSDAPVAYFLTPQRLTAVDDSSTPVGKMQTLDFRQLSVEELDGLSVEHQQALVILHQQLQQANQELSDARVKGSDQCIILLSAHPEIEIEEHSAASEQTTKSVGVTAATVAAAAAKTSTAVKASMVASTAAKTSLAAAATAAKTAGTVKASFTGAAALAKTAGVAKLGATKTLISGASVKLGATKALMISSAPAGGIVVPIVLATGGVLGVIYIWEHFGLRDKFYKWWSGDGKAVVVPPLPAPHLLPAPPVSVMHSLNSTEDLICKLRLLPPDSPDYKQLRSCAKEILEEFAQIEVKTPSLIREVSLLCLIGKENLTRPLLKKLVEGIEKERFSEELIYYLKALSLVFRSAHLKEFQKLPASDLVNILTTIFLKVPKLHQQSNQPELFYHMMRTLGELLDVMGDANVKGLNKEECYDPLWEVFSVEKQVPDMGIVSWAAYARQSLSRIPYDQHKLVLYGGHIANVIIAGGQVIQVVRNLDFSPLSDAYERFKRGLNWQENPKAWYEEVRHCSFLLTPVYHEDGTLEDLDFERFQEFVMEEAEGISYKHVAGCILNLVYDAILEHADNDQFHRKAIDFLKKVFEDDRWAHKSLTEHVKEGLVNAVKRLGISDANSDPDPFKAAILQKLCDLATHPTQPLRDYALEALTSLKGNSTDLTKTLVPRRRSSGNYEETLFERVKNKYLHQ